MEKPELKKSQPHCPADRARLERVSGLIAFAGFLVFGASLFSLPFPFSRVIWLKPALGVSGLLNSALFLLISQRMKRKSILAVFAGFGILLYEQIKTGSAFTYVYFQNRADLEDWAFLIGSTAFIFFLASLLFLSLNPIYTYIRTLPRRFYLAQRSSFSEKKISLQTGALAASAVLYAVIFAGIGVAPRLDLRFQFSVFKVLGEAACIVFMVGVGQEISFYLEEIQNRFICFSKILTHVLVLAGLFLFLYHRMPIEQFMV